jgi:hypothetical protein
VEFSEALVLDPVPFPDTRTLALGSPWRQHRPVAVTLFQETTGCHRYVSRSLQTVVFETELSLSEKTLIKSALFLELSVRFHFLKGYVGFLKCGNYCILIDNNMDSKTERCDFGIITQLPCASVFSSEKWR